MQENIGHNGGRKSGGAHEIETKEECPKGAVSTRQTVTVSTANKFFFGPPHAFPTARAVIL
ncbi:MAG: hypothetical protein ACRYFX_07610 [Janthinobacterium lividum]